MLMSSSQQVKWKGFSTICQAVFEEKKNQKPCVLLTMLCTLMNKTCLFFLLISTIHGPHLSFLFTETICVTTYFQLPLKRRNNIIHATKNYLVLEICKGWEQHRTKTYQEHRNSVPGQIIAVDSVNKNPQTHMFKDNVTTGPKGDDACQPRTGTAASPEHQENLPQAEIVDGRSEGLSEIKEEKYSLAQLSSVWCPKQTYQPDLEMIRYKFSVSLKA